MGFNCRTKRCDDCGFTKGTKANSNGVTEIKAQLCAEIPEPFYCHFNAKENEKAGGTELIVPEDKMFLCQGWVETCNELESENYYQTQPEWRRELKSVIVEAICDIEEKLQAKEITQEEAVLYINQKVADFQPSSERLGERK